MARERGGRLNTGAACCSGAAFFLYSDHGRGAIAQHTGGVADAAAIESHSDHLVADRRYAAAIVVVEEKDPSRAPVVLTLIALGAGGLFTRLNDLRAVSTTLDGNGSHPCPPHTVIMLSLCKEKLLIWNITGEERSDRIQNIGSNIE